VSSAPAHAKINLALVVGPIRPDGLHEVVTILQRIDLADTITLDQAEELIVEGFVEDTLVTRALRELAAAAGTEPGWRARIDKRIPVAAGLGGGSSDAATALRLANETLPDPLSREQLHEIARALGADVPFFVEPGPQLGTGDGSTLSALALPQDYVAVLLLPDGVAKESTGAVYARFDGAAGFEERGRRVLEVIASASSAVDLAALPPNDLASSPLAPELVAAGAFRADVSGAGPAVYGLFADLAAAQRAASELAVLGATWVVSPAW
jgi:4-diphosphocytidyl-2-C-methyl-D-erythritol kinase